MNSPSIIDQSQAWLQTMKSFKAELLSGQPVDQGELEKERLQYANPDLTLLQTDQEKICYWLNVYNGLTCYWLAKHGVRSTVGEIPAFFKQPVTWGGYSLTLDDIEHGLLRRKGRPPFLAQDPRWQLCVEVLDYLIHFALNCGAASCPAIFGYTLQDLFHQLLEAENLFLVRHFRVDHAVKQIHCLDLFEKYRADFGDRFLNQFPDYSVTLTPFDWTLH